MPLPMGEGGRRPGDGSVADRDALADALTLLAIISDEKKSNNRSREVSRRKGRRRQESVWRIVLRK